MTDNDDDFFEGKRLWSIIKDQVLKQYMTPYLAKVKRLNKPILLVDGYAGPGIFGDDKPGSPLIMCQAAENNAPGNYQAFFINKKKKYHTQLERILQETGFNRAAIPILGDTIKILPLLPNILQDQTVFLYLDPFGPTGSPFALLQPFLTRNVNYSTEMVIMMHMPILHRLAAKNAVAAGRQEEELIQKMHQRITLTLGGDYWKPILWNDNLSTEQKDFKLIEEYRKMLAGYLPYTGCCPVREGPRDRIKYFIVFVSRHPDAILLMNDVMIKAYFMRMNEDIWAGTMFAETTHWTEMLSTDGLDEAILQAVKNNPGLTREELWINIVQKNFMKYRWTDFWPRLNQLVDNNVLQSPTPRKQKRLNNTCKIFIR